MSNLINEKIYNIAIYGSCITKDPFTTVFNKNYKEYFSAVINDQRHSFISTMQEKKDVPDEDIIILPQIGNNKFETRCIREDFDKKFISDIMENHIDYLVFDVHFEVENGVLRYGDDEYITNFARLDQTPLYDKLPDKRPITVYDSPEEFYNLWKIYCDKFFTFMKENSPDTTMILAEVRALDTVQTDDQSIRIEEEYTEKSKTNNKYYKQLEDYIKENYDVYLVTFDKDTILKENHRWGKHFLHYNDEYYTNFLKKVIQIVEYDQLKKNETRYKMEIEELKKNMGKTDNTYTEKIKKTNNDLIKANRELTNQIRILNNELKKSNTELNNVNIDLRLTNRDIKRLTEENSHLKHKNIKLESQVKKKNSSLLSRLRKA